MHRRSNYQFLYEYDHNNYYGCDISIKDAHIMEYDPRRSRQREKEVYPIIFMNKHPCYRWEEAGQRNYHSASARRYEYSESKYFRETDARLTSIEIFTLSMGYSTLAINKRR